MRAKDREVAKAKEERDTGRAAERERAKVRRVMGGSVMLVGPHSGRGPR